MTASTRLGTLSDLDVERLRHDYPTDPVAALTNALRTLLGVPDGEMAAVFATPERVEQVLAPHSASVAIAAINGPESVTISGRAAMVEQVMAELRALGIETRRLAVPVAAHSPQIDPVH